MLWNAINPRKSLSISNATAYDILLLLTYKVNLSVPQLASAVGEYLYRLYNDQLQIDVDQFGTELSPQDAGYKTKVINAYLNHLGIPSINKLCLSFK